MEPTEGQQIGHKRGFVRNDLMRQTLIRDGGGKRLAINLINILEARGGRTTIELCRALDIPHRKLCAVVSIARKYARDHENVDIRAIRGESSGLVWHYWMVFDPDGLIKRAVDNVMRAGSLLGSARNIMAVVQAHSMDGDHEKAASMINQPVDGFAGVTQEVLQRVEFLMPGTVAESRLNAKPPSPAELLGSSEEPAGGARDDIWDIARRSAKRSVG